MLGPGLVVSHYRLMRRLGAGGMGDVYLAQDTSLDRPVAIKFLIAPDDEHGRQRLLREARAVAALEHPHICGVYEVGTDPVGGDFIVMQYIEGESLAARLKRGRLPPDEALRIAGHIAEALQTAHRRGIIHRDLKPQNVIITPAGSPKLLDFGLARQLESSDVAAEAQTISPLTQPHAVIGTAGYMAPEQLRGRPVDARTDVFALGCVLYECLTGRRAFTGTTAADINGQALHVDPPAVSSVVPELGAAYDALCARLLQKAPAERLQSAEEVVGAIRALAGGPRSAEVVGTETRRSPTTSSWSFLRGRAVVALAATLVVVALVTLWELRGTGLPTPPSNVQRWYDQGVESLRQGTYAVARAQLQQAVDLFPKYVQAYSRLAEASSELDDQPGAQHALLVVNELVPNRTRLDKEDRLRLEAVLASVQRHHDEAILLYTKLAELHAKQASGWLDLGRAEEANETVAGRKAARAHYLKALDLDSQYAPAHLRLAVLLSQEADTPQALVSIEEAIRLYHAGGSNEGEAEAVLRKGRALSTAHRFPEARESLNRVLQLAADPRFLSQRLRARFELARATAAAGKFEEATSIATAAVDEANNAEMPTLAAEGLIELADALISKGRYELADARLSRAIELAHAQGAKRTEMRARLQMASLRLSTGKPAEVIALTEPLLAFFADRNQIRSQVDAKNIESRAHEDLEQYDEARRLATEALQLAGPLGDPLITATSLGNLASQFEKLGKLPDALIYRARAEPLYRDAGLHSDLAYNLTNRAELLIRLGRGDETRPIFEEIDRGIKDGVDAYVGRSRRCALLRALLATTQLRFTEVVGLATAARTPPGVEADGTDLYAKVLIEHARAHLGTSRAAPAAIGAWPSESKSPPQVRELSYWAAQTLLARGEDRLAYGIASGAWSAPAGQSNLELRWRLAAVAFLASKANHLTSDSPGAKMPPHEGQIDLAGLAAAWGNQAETYLKRQDLDALRKAMQ
jgi:tetratricopeptide (TPR) repeat protein/predicted Ser/Thr protein kinase